MKPTIVANRVVPIWISVRAHDKPHENGVVGSTYDRRNNWSSAHGWSQNF